VAVINQALAGKYFPGQDPVGQTIANDEGGRPSVWEVVGVVDDVREGRLMSTSGPRNISPSTKRGTTSSAWLCEHRKSQERC
jgi:macrolide transport system ATP-binding/permease protein